MDSLDFHPWTFIDLVGAFINLAMAYFLLCGSAFAFFASKLLILLGLCLSCPCKGVWGYRNRDMCFHKILLDWPARKIHAVEMRSMGRFPFHLLKDRELGYFNEEAMKLGEISDNGVLRLDNEASCSSCSALMLQGSVDRSERANDAKGKRVIDLRRKPGVRRRRRTTQECFKVSLLQSDSIQSDYVLGSKITRKSLATGRQGPQDDEDGLTGNDMDEKTCNAFKGGDKYLYLTENYESNGQDKESNGKDEIIRMLKQALEKEQSAYAALLLELEKERAAAASAADEAMAMILRLQEEKASIQMETRHCQRMIEERFAYDEEEMTILKEILVRREKENHFLERELEVYRQMTYEGNEPSIDLLDEVGKRPPPSLSLHENLQRIPHPLEGSKSVVNNEGSQRPPPSFDLHANLLLIPKQSEGSKSIVKNEESCATGPSCSAPPFDLRANLLLIPKQSEGSKSIVKNEECCAARPSSSAPQTCTVGEKVLLSNEKEMKKDTEQKVFDSYLHNSKLDAEPDVLDVHVVDNDIKTMKEKSENISRLSFNNASIPPRGRSNSLPANIKEKLKIDTEIIVLGERLRLVQDGKQRFAKFSDNEKSSKVELKLLEEIVNQLQEIKQLRDPLRRASLPPLSSKVKLKKRRCQSVSSDTCDSS